MLYTRRNGSIKAIPIEHYFEPISSHLIGFDVHTGYLFTWLRIAAVKSSSHGNRTEYHWILKLLHRNYYFSYRAKMRFFSRFWSRDEWFVFLSMSYSVFLWHQWLITYEITCNGIAAYHPRSKRVFARNTILGIKLIESICSLECLDIVR